MSLLQKFFSFCLFQLSKTQNRDQLFSCFHESTRRSDQKNSMTVIAVIGFFRLFLGRKPKSRRVHWVARGTGTPNVELKVAEGYLMSHHSESNQGHSDIWNPLQSDSLPTELW